MDKPAVHDVAAAVMPLEIAYDNDVVYPDTVRNISATGISLCVSMDPDNFSRERVNIRLALQLPGHRSAYEIVTRVCYRTFATSTGRNPPVHRRSWKS
jgi:hypothetical protein